MGSARDRIWQAARSTGAAQAGAARVAATVAVLLLAATIARFGWQLPIASSAERAFYDVRAWCAAARVEEDPRIALVVFTDETLAATGKRSPLDRALLARALTNIDALRPRAIAVDILIDQPQPEDGALITALRGLRTPTWLGFAAAADGEYVKPWQEAHLRKLMAQVASSKVRPALIRIDVDTDGTMRSWPTPVTGTPALLAKSVVPGSRFGSYRGAVAQRLPRIAGRSVFMSLPIDLFADAQAAAALAPQIAGRVVLIGGDLPDADRFETPTSRLTGNNEAGVQLHAALVAQALDGRPAPPVPDWALWLAAAGTVALGAATGGVDGRTRIMVPLAVIQLAAIAALPVLVQAQGIDTLTLPAFGLLAGWLIAAAAASALARSVGSEQRRFAQGALGRYLPRDVAEQILRDPAKLALHGERRDIYALFTDIEGFTSMCQALSPEEVATILNTYLETMSETVLAHGGTIDKFVGDAVVAFWGAPIARPGDAASALAAARAMSAAGTRLAAASMGGPALGRTRVGLHWGEAIVGNFGGDGRIQYTALGDSMNVASRLEGANKQLKTGILASREAAERAGIHQFRAMGRVRVRGRLRPVEVFEPLGPDTADLSALYASFDGGDRDALADLRACAAAAPDDIALTRFVDRLETIGPGGIYDLD